MSETLLSVRNLDVSYYSSRGTFRALNKVSVDIGYGEVLAVVGETGCGKSTFGSAIPRLLPFPGEVDGGEIILEGENLLTKTEEGMREVRRHKVAVIFQDATASLNPVFRIGKQLASSIQAASRQGSKETGAETVRMLSEVGIADAAKVARQYPHELSGGMRQRVVIAIALARSPRLLIADEPTSNLDVTIQAQIVDLIMELRERMGMSIILIAHSMGLVAQTCDRVGVMYAGNLVEVGSAVDVFKEPQHPYTRGLLELAALIEEEDSSAPSPARCGSPRVGRSAAASPNGAVWRGAGRKKRRCAWSSGPTCGRPGAGIASPATCTRDAMPPLEPPPSSSSSPIKPAKLLEVRNLRKHFPIREGLLQRVRSHVHAVDGVSLPSSAAARSGWSGRAAAARPPAAAV